MADIAGTERENPEYLLSERQVEQRYGLRVKTLQGWRMRRVGPPFVRFSVRMVRYPLGKLEKFLASRTVAGNAESTES